MPKPLDLTGQTFGYLTALSPTDKRDKSGNIYWLCKCSKCGKETLAIGRDLKRGQRTSCGCSVGEIARAKNKAKTDILGGTNPSQLKMKTPNTNTTGVKGVSKYYRHGVFSGYRAYITFKGKQIHGGVFKTIEEAKGKRMELELQYLNPLIKSEKLEIKKQNDIVNVLEFYKKNGRTPMSKDFGGKYRAMINRHGTWNNLLVNAGLEPTKIKRNTEWTKDELAEEAKKVAVNGEISFGDFPLRNRAKELFGSWDNFRKYCGLEIRKREEPNYLGKPFTSYTDGELIEHIQVRAKELGRTPKVLDITISSQLVQRFGNWTNLLKLAELELVADHDYLTQEQLITKAQKDSHLGYIASSEFSHYYQAKREFGSWENFKKKAGLLDK